MKFDFLGRRIHLVTGKGGVGRTTVAVALARALAARGKRVLLAEVGTPEGNRSAVGRFFGHEYLDDQPRPVAPGLSACCLWASTGQELFGRAVLPAGPLIRAALRSNALRRLLAAAPALFELGIFYHLLTLLEQQNSCGGVQHESVVIDMPATGHTLALTTLPDVALRLVPKGAIAEAMRRGQRWLNDSRFTAAWVVTLPQHLPVTEAAELVQGLKDTRVPVGGVILNRFLVDPFSDQERQAAIEILQRHRIRGALAFRRIEIARAESERLAALANTSIVRIKDFGTLVEAEVCDEICHALGEHMQARA